MEWNDLKIPDFFNTNQLLNRKRKNSFNIDYNIESNVENVKTQIDTLNFIYKQTKLVMDKLKKNFTKLIDRLDIKYILDKKTLDIINEINMILSLEKINVENENYCNKEIKQIISQSDLILDFDFQSDEDFPLEKFKNGNMSNLLNSLRNSECYIEENALWLMIKNTIYSPHGLKIKLK